MVTMVTVLTMGVTTTAHVVLLETTIESHGVGSLKESLSPGLNQRTRERVGVHGACGASYVWGAERNGKEKTALKSTKKHQVASHTHPHTHTHIHALITLIPHHSSVIELSVCTFGRFLFLFYVTLFFFFCMKYILHGPPLVWGALHWKIEDINDENDVDCCCCCCCCWCGDNDEEDDVTILGDFKGGVGVDATTVPSRAGAGS
jgi:hypothetical protein